MSVEPAAAADQDAQQDIVARRGAELLRRTSTEAERADMKASILLAGMLAVTGGVLALLSTAKWNPLTQPAWVQVGWWAAVLATLAGLVALGRAVYPRAHRPDPRRSIIGYFDDIVRYGSVDALAEALRDGPDENAVMVDQVWQISPLVHAKYRLIRLAIRAFLLSVVLLLVVMVAALAR